MADKWFITARTPEEIHVYDTGEQTGTPADADRQAAMMEQVKTDLSFPPDWAWPWDLAYSPGEPHSSVMAEATVHDWTEWTA